MSVTTPPRAPPLRVRSARRISEDSIARMTIASTPVTASGRVDSRNLIGHGNDNTHWRTGTDGSTVAIIQPSEDATLSEGDVQAHVAAVLARSKVPSRVFFIDDVLPRTATGKVLKRELKQRFGS